LSQNTDQPVLEVPKTICPHELLGRGKLVVKNIIKTSSLQVFTAVSYTLW